MGKIRLKERRGKKLLFLGKVIVIGFLVVLNTGFLSPQPNGQEDLTLGNLQGPQVPLDYFGVCGDCLWRGVENH